MNCSVFKFASVGPRQYRPRIGNTNLMIINYSALQEAAQRVEPASSEGMLCAKQMTVACERPRERTCGRSLAASQLAIA